MVERILKSNLDLDAEIDLDKVKAAIKDFGPIRISQPGNPFELFFDVSPCRCEQVGCTKEVVTIHRITGFRKSHGLWMLQSFWSMNR